MSDRVVTFGGELDESEWSVILSVMEEQHD